MLLSSVTAYAVNGNGSNGSVLGSAVTDSSGKFAIQLMAPQPGPVRVTASGGSFVSEMDGSTVSSPASISALLADASSTVSGISINPLSEFVNSRAIARAVGSSIATALPLAISDIEKDYGLSSDPATLAPDYTAADVSTDAGKLE